jgi:hypothetical protein
LLHLADERSPVTGTPYVPLSRLQAAHWSFSKLQRIVTKSSTTFEGTATSRPGLKLGFEVEATELSSNESNQTNTGHDAYWPVPIDTSLRIGDPGSAAPTEDFFSPSSARSSAGCRSVSARNFFGIGNPRRAKSSFTSGNNDALMIASSTKPGKWVPYEPFRFSVEFWGVESLKEKTRLYSHTIFYAGSCYNVYIQTVRKKGLQLGVYLHRQSNVDPIPAASTPRALNAQPSPSVCPASLPSSDSFARNSSSVTLVLGSRSPVRTAPSTDSASPRGITPGPSSRSPILRSSTPVAIPRAPHYIHSNASFSPSSPASPISSPGSHVTVGLPSNGNVPNNFLGYLLMASIATPSFATPAPPHQHYRDPRPAVSAFFSIACHSSTSSSLTRFSSAPDTVSYEPFQFYDVTHAPSVCSFSVMGLEELLPGCR